jgi:peroxiredoxin family protein
MATAFPTTLPNFDASPQAQPGTHRKVAIIASRGGLD